MSALDVVFLAHPRPLPTLIPLWVWNTNSPLRALQGQEPSPRKLAYNALSPDGPKYWKSNGTKAGRLRCVRQWLQIYIMAYWHWIISSWYKQACNYWETDNKDTGMDGVLVYLRKLIINKSKCILKVKDNTQMIVFLRIIIACTVVIFVLSSRPFLSTERLPKNSWVGKGFTGVYWSF